MRLFQDKREHRRMIFSWLTMLFVLVVTVVLVRAVFNIYPKYQLASESRQAIQTEEKELNSRQNQLEDDINRLGSKTGEESELRSKYQVSRPGEEVVVIVGDKIKSNKQKETASVGHTNSANLFDYIKSLFVK